MKSKVVIVTKSAILTAELPPGGRSMEAEKQRVLEIAVKVAELVCDSELDRVMCAAALEIAGQLIALDGHLRREAEYASPATRAGA